MCLMEIELENYLNYHEGFFVAFLVVLKQQETSCLSLPNAWITSMCVHDQLQKGALVNNK